MKSAGVIGWISARNRCKVARWMRASRRRSHHSSMVPPGENQPRRTAPSDSRSRRTVLASSALTPSDSPRPLGVTGPTSASRPRNSSTAAVARVHVTAARAVGTAIAGSQSRLGRPPAVRAAVRRRPTTRPATTGATRRSPGRRRSSSSRSGRHPASRCASAAVRNPAVTSASCSSSASRGSGRASADHRNRRGIEHSERDRCPDRRSIGVSARRAPAALRAAHRRGTRTAAHSGSRERGATARSCRGPGIGCRRCGYADEDLDQARQVHRLLETVAHGLA